MTKNNIKEDAPGMSAGGGAVAGIGIPSPNPNLTNQAEPGIKKKKKVASFISFMRRKAPV